MTVSEAAPILELQGLNKSYGALHVTKDVSLTVRRGEIHALIGPNGAGKTTLIGQISGSIAPNSGAIVFAGEDVSSLGVAQRARKGLGRSFQITAILPAFSVLENVALAVQAKDGHSFRFFKRASSDAELNNRAKVYLEMVGMTARAGLRAGDLSHGEKRVLEVAIALAGGPKLMLLDEPMAGTGPEETERLVTVLHGLKAKIPMLLIEHDMSAVFQLADRISVLVYGEIIASGAPEDIRRDPAVREAYLGGESDL
ncbi:amino acid/amide ABC transporter ATP-binding protein 1, HAAT family (TC 3.A.1.4.-) [Roseibium hamelinense]|uniref:Amino acid/amide ABC transporter ATP-binding protein 1, HAAT family (TC 3.A.1.4.-) n=1 Tax=Roseibium hamelinense TaxID=150831 RepID=A0A562T8C8_9HYPH|nr:ABC transporter ATP-binding protein [Roseibium hamelinense]MTI42793.1 ABC transporter ATP-binding protein [Roseibium hamelinense]TWI89458.1 amino acid/amide ABC transporter ATP-binding protein 1, HAAT family (TC 3.A.1.4.-) [Roseibium hamelinense]